MLLSFCAQFTKVASPILFPLFFKLDETLDETCLLPYDKHMVSNTV